MVRRPPKSTLPERLLPYTTRFRSEEDARGMVLGKLFVAEYFPERSKQRYSDMVESVRTVYAERIKKLDWMSDVTKEKALDKLAKMSKKVGARKSTRLNSSH